MEAPTRAEGMRPAFENFESLTGYSITVAEPPVDAPGRPGFAIDWAGGTLLLPSHLGDGQRLLAIVLALGMILGGRQGAWN